MRSALANPNFHLIEVESSIHYYYHFSFYK
jgi:hypothetical protein